MDIIGLLRTILSALGGISGRVSALIGLIDALATLESQKQQTDLLTGISNTLIDAGTTGGYVHDTVASISDNLTALSAAFGLFADGIADGSITPTPVSPPPDGYTTDVSGLVAEVWQHNPAGNTYPDIAFQVRRTYMTTWAMGNLGNIGMSFAPYFWVNGYEVADKDRDDPYTFPKFPLDLITADITLFDFLYLNNVGWGMTYGVVAPGHWLLWHTDNPFNFTCVFTDETFAQLKRDLGIVPFSTPVGVWPGIDKVTLGDSVALVEGHLAIGPCNGVIVEISDVAGNPNLWNYGDTVAYRNIGGIAFYDDNGQIETFQALAFPTAVFVPHAIAIPSGVVVKVSPSVTATITPWTIT